MRTSRTIVILVVVVVSAAIALLWLVLNYTQYQRFKRRSPEYFADLAKACDSLVDTYPVGTNRFVEVPAAGASIPRIIRDLHPVRIKVEPKCVWILHGGPIQFGIAWEQDELRTNVWTLSTACESHITTVYTAPR